MSADEEIPEEIRQFILQCIDSVELLRVLLLLHSNPEREWNAEEIEKDLRSSASAIEKRMRDLYTRGILERGPKTGIHRYVPCNPEIGGLIDRIAEYYKQRPYRVIQLIYSRPMEAIKSIADAFKIKKDE